MQPRKALFLSLMVTYCSGERSFSKWPKMLWRVAMFQKRLSTLNIRCIKSDKLRQTNCNEFLDNFVMKKAGQNLLTTAVLLKHFDVTAHFSPRLWFWVHFTKNLFQNSWLGVIIALSRNISRPNGWEALVYCVMFSLTWFDYCSFLFLHTYLNNDNTSENLTCPVATVVIGQPFQIRVWNTINQ